MAIKKYTNGSWTPACRKYGTETDTITTFPATIIGDGTPITSYTIKGNMEQTGTPTPENPIMPIGCGERTENLFDYTDLEKGFIDISTGENFPNDAQKRTRNYITVQANTAYTFSNYYDKCRIHQYSNNSYLGSDLTNEPQYSFTTNSNCTKIRISGNKDNFLEDTMLNLGSTALPYEPYGYKLPLTLGSTTTDIYLGEVQSTRWIKKLVLTGEEDWIKSSIGYNAFYFLMIHGYPHPKLNDSAIICNIATFTQLPDNYTRYPWFCVSDNSFGISTDSAVIGGTAVADWKSYLAQQYANGAPVTIWYVLREPATGIVNEPIRKIGDYVDSVSGTNLVTSGTAQEFDINATLKPSEVDMTYHGWHEHEDTKFTT